MGSVFDTRASTHRRKIIAYLNEGELTAGKIAERFEFSKPAQSGHLRIVEDAGLITGEKHGPYTHFKPLPDRLANTIFAWAAKVCPVAGPLKRESRGNARKRSTPGAN
jgi:ArsR family transcriptional regulator, arsenate/arsenite/antimonite-responsive transcriptional repressor